MTKVYYSIKEVSQMLNLTYATLHYWEREIPQLSPKKNSGKTRFYTQEDIETIRRIKYLREEEHLSLEGVKQRLKNDIAPIDQRQKQNELLHKIREELVALRNLI